MNIAAVFKSYRFLALACCLLALFALLASCGKPAASTPPSASQTPLLPQEATFNQQTSPARIHLPVSHISQLPELPNGCEATALTMVLSYYGFNADKLDIAYNVLPRENCSQVNGLRYGPNPNEKYAGDPAVTGNGYYCFPSAAAKGTADYFATLNVHEKYQIEDISGYDSDALENLLGKGVPLIVWAAKEYSSQIVYSNNGWHLPDGTFYTPYSNLHCVVMVGYTANEYIICDPLEDDSYLYINKQIFMESYQAMGSMALAIQEVPSS